MSASPLGLLVVHGIGNQRPGELCREIASALADGQRGSVDRGDKAAERGLLERVTVGVVPVVVAEANWSALSSPDNPPVVRSATPVFSDLLDTIRAAWRSSRAAGIVRRLDRRHHHIGSISTAAFILLLLATFVGPVLHMDEYTAPAIYGVGLFWLGLTFHLVWRSVRYRFLRLRRASGLRRFLEAALWGAVSYFVGASLLIFLPFFGAVMFFYFAVAVAMTWLLVLAAGIVARLFAWVAAVMGLAHAAGARTWTHRLGWVMVALPSHVLLEAVRAAGNLFSVMLAERAWAPRLTAFGGLFGVYFGFVLLMLVCEILLMPAVVVAIFTLNGELTADAGLAVGIVLIATFLPYLWFIKRTLPAIDLLLDVANYHLAGEADRRSYHATIEHAVTALVRAGCGEIHILAHSLGTVLVYDWLKSMRQGTYPIAVLHTIGSPLDKFWYIDHGITRRRADLQGLGAHVSRRWTNYWAWSDPVSGALHHYDGPGMRVINEKLKQLGPFLVSHVRYWKDEAVLGAVRREIAAAQ